MVDTRCLMFDGLLAVGSTWVLAAGWLRGRREYFSGPGAPRRLRLGLVLRDVFVGFVGLNEFAVE